MAIYEILNDKDEVVNTIIADPVFMSSFYKGVPYRPVAAPETVLPESEKAKTIDEKLDEIIALLKL